MRKFYNFDGNKFSISPLIAVHVFSVSMHVFQCTLEALLKSMSDIHGSFLTLNNDKIYI